MASVGLLFVGAVLFLNGLMLLGKIEPRSTGIFNLFVGAMQVILPTLSIITDPTPANILASSGIYLFGFTYLYIGVNLLGGFDTSGFGYFALFVAIASLGYSYASFQILGDPAFGVIWLYFAFLWFLFYLLLGLKREELTVYTGWVTAIEGWVTSAIPAYLMLTGMWRSTGVLAGVLAVIGVVVFVALWPLTRGLEPAGATAGREPRPRDPDRTHRPRWI
jgi:hypothetical protein